MPISVSCLGTGGEGGLIRPSASSSQRPLAGVTGFDPVEATGIRSSAPSKASLLPQVNPVTLKPCDGSDSLCFPVFRADHESHFPITFSIVKKHSGRSAGEVADLPRRFPQVTTVWPEPGREAENPPCSLATTLAYHTLCQSVKYRA